MPSNLGLVTRLQPKRSEPRHELDEPWVEPMTGWRLGVTWALLTVGCWLLVAGLVTTVYALIVAWPDVLEILSGQW